MGEGHTPLESVSGEPLLRYKREDLNPTGSHKDRAASFQLAAAHAAGARGVVISSSGNAGIATSQYAALHNLPAFVVVHPDTDPTKLTAINGATTTLIITARAINTAKRIAREFSFPNLRPSVSDEAIVGYATLGDELLDIEFDDLVLFATSGATAIGVANVLCAAEHAVRIHVVQGEGNAGLVDPKSHISDDSAHSAAAGRLGVRRSRRARELRAAIELSGGRGWVSTASDVASAHARFLHAGISVSDESAANDAVARQLVNEGNRVVCIVSGAPPLQSHDKPQRTLRVDNEAEAIEQLQGLVV